MVVSLVRWPKPKPDAPRRTDGVTSAVIHTITFYARRSGNGSVSHSLTHHPLCEHCTLLGQTTPATQADHIVRLVDNDHFRRTSWAGLQALCAGCHARKSKWERGTQRRQLRLGTDPDGYNIDAAKWFRIRTIKRGRRPKPTVKLTQSTQARAPWRLRPERRGREIRLSLASSR